MEMASRLAGDSSQSIEQKMRTLLDKRRDLQDGLELQDAVIHQFKNFTPSLADAEFVDVEFFAGDETVPGITKELVDVCQRPVAVLQWLDDATLARKFGTSGALANQMWGSGVLLDGDRLLTAGHCFTGVTPFGMPRMEPDEAALAMRVVFGHQRARTGAMQEEAFSIVGLLKCVSTQDGADYAVVQLAGNGITSSPSAKYGSLKLAASDAPRGSDICIIQQPRYANFLKKVAVGKVARNKAGGIFYDAMETDEGSSGSPIVNDQGEIVGVHHGGDWFQGSTRGTSVSAITLP
jgi:V8-like Glu-specific endopeptidase